MATVDELMALGMHAEQAKRFIDAFITEDDSDTIPSGVTFTVAGTIDVTGAFQIGSVAVDATAAEINRAADLSARLVGGGAALSLTAALHDMKTVTWDTATGTALTLPAATGTGAIFHCAVATALSSGSHTLACVGTDEFAGVLYQVDTDTTDTVASYPALAADNFDTITMNGTTTGGLIGDWISVQDIASGIWALKGWTNANGVVATPLSSAV